MRTRTFFFAMLIAVSTTAMAGNDDPTMTVVSTKGSQVFKVIYKGATTGKVKVYLYEPHGRVIHSETITGMNGFIYPVNFRGLKPGTYKFQVISEEGRYEEEVTYGDEDRKSIHVTKLGGAEGKFLLSIANARNEEVQVSIFEEGQGWIFDETKNLNEDFAQVYRLPNAYKRYTFRITDAEGNRKTFSF